MHRDMYMSCECVWGCFDTMCAELLRYKQPSTRLLNVQCITLQHSATLCNTLQHSATSCNKLQQAATSCNKQQVDCTMSD